MLVPSGSTSMFHALMSDSEMFLPRPGVSANAADPTTADPNASESAKGNKERTRLRVDMLDLPFAVDAPGREAVVVLIGESQRIGHRPLGLAAGGDEFGAGRLSVAALVPGAADEDHGLAVPAPGHGETRERLRVGRPLQRRLRPALAAIGRDRDLGDAAGAGIGDTRYLVVARTFERLAERRMRDERLDLHDEVELHEVLVGEDLRVGLGLVVAHRRLVDELEPAHVLDVHVALIAGQQQAHRIAIARHEPLAVLV